MPAYVAENNEMKENFICEKPRTFDELMDQITSFQE